MRGHARAARPAVLQMGGGGCTLWITLCTLRPFGPVDLPVLSPHLYTVGIYRYSPLYYVSHLDTLVYIPVDKSAYGRA